MRLVADKAFSGSLGNASQGQEFEVTSAIGKAMIADGYPVKEVRANGGNTRKRGTAAADSHERP